MMLRVKQEFLLQSHFEYFCLTSLFPLVFTSHGASNSRVSEGSKIVFTFVMIPEALWTVIQNVVLTIY